MAEEKYGVGRDDSYINYFSEQSMHCSIVKRGQNVIQRTNIKFNEG